MKKEFRMRDAIFIYSKDEFGYQQVLDEMKTAAEITIVTYNISERQKYLRNCIEAAPADCNITIFTNIPSRWDSYCKDMYRESAKRKIEVYLTKLAPEKLGQRASVYFDFSNHGKIIMTDSVVYIGSENYSEESKSNSEFGVLSRDKDLISYLISEIIPELEKHSVRYYEYDFTSLALEAQMMLSALFNLFSELHQQTHKLDDHVEGQYYFNDTDDSLSQITLDAIGEIIESSNAVIDEISDAICTINSSNGNKQDEGSENNEIIQTLTQRLLELLESSDILELADFNCNNYALGILQEEYVMEAYDEYLDEYVERASDQANAVLYDLCYSAKDTIDELLQKLEQYQDIFKQIIENFIQYEIRKTNPEIDNT